MFLQSVSRHFIQTLPPRENDQNHNPLWLKDLGIELTTNKLDLDGESSNTAPQAHHSMQTHNSPARYLGKV